MLRLRSCIAVSIVLFIALTSCGQAPTSQQAPSPGQRTPVSTPKTPTAAITSSPQVTATPQGASLQHIFYIVMENHSTNQIISNSADAPYLNQLATTYGTVAHFYAVTHPSLPNYLASIAGDFQGIWDDCPAGATITCAPQDFGSSLTRDQYSSASNQAHMFSGQTIVDQLEAHAMTWKAYMQSMPSPGYTGASYGFYAQKHDPFMYFSRIRNNPERMQRIVPFTQFDQDLQSNNVANFVWISPDLCNDMHGAPSCDAYNASIALGDNFVHSTVQKILQSQAWQQGSAIVIVWDENYGGSAGCCKSPVGLNGMLLGGADVPVIVVSSHVPQHIVLQTGSYNHYSLLATIEQLWNLGCLANTCGFNNASLMTRLFVSG